MKRILALLLLATSAPAFGVEWFNHGVKPIESGTILREDLSAQSCRSCHESVYRDWSKSRHSVSWTNSIFHEGFLLESQDRCIFCHAPMREQFSEIKGKRELALASEGVNCTACHVREGRVFSGHTAGLQFHSWQKDPVLKTSEFCAGCHQFNFNKTIDGEALLTPLVVQNTYNEWREYQEHGGKKTCQGCHMPEGRHTFQGAHSERVLASGISLNTRVESGGYAFVLAAKNVGHRVPTGDLFRHLTLEVAPEVGGDFKTIATVGRVYGVAVDLKTGDTRQDLQSDTSLGPFEKRLMRMKGVSPIRYRLVYHYTSARDEARSHLAREELTKVVRSGTLSPKRQSAGTIGMVPGAPVAPPTATAPDALVKLDGDRFILDLRYKQPDNFLKKDVYGPLGLEACWVLPQVQANILKIVPELKKRKLKIILWDCFRPLSIQREMWKLVPDERYVANPAKGSNHNRGCALDLSLAREDGKPLEMPTVFDSFESTAHVDYKCKPEEMARCANRATLMGLMKKAGMKPLPTEWWHYQLPDALKFPVRESLDGVPQPSPSPK